MNSFALREKTKAKDPFLFLPETIPGRRLSRSLLNRQSVVLFNTHTQTLAEVAQIARMIKLATHIAA